MARYDVIGDGYSTVRRADPRLAAAIWKGLGDARSVLNLGAGTGSYEPLDRNVLAVEPSSLMLAQRGSDAAPALQASAESLPLADRTVDAAMAILTLHHWSDLEQGLAELVRVTRKRIVLVTMDVDAVRATWLIDEYLAEAMEAHLQRFPTLEEIVDCLPDVAVRPLPVPRDCSDGFMVAFWGRPEAYLDPVVRAATSPWHDAQEHVAQAALERLAEDLASGAWDRCHGALRHKPEHDVGLRLVVAEPLR